MASKKALLGGATVKVENMSGFDKSRYHGFTAPLGAIVPMLKQLCIPGKVKVSLKISASLPPLATDAFLRTHLKVEAFYCPLRLAYGGFQSWFAGEQVVAQLSTATLTRAKLPYLNIPDSVIDAVYDADLDTPISEVTQAWLDKVFGPHSLMDYFGVKVGLQNSHVRADATRPLPRRAFNIFPFICYQRIIDYWYRNKLVERPLFAPTAGTFSAPLTGAWSLPFASYNTITPIEPNVGNVENPLGASDLLNGHLLDLRQRNYGFDYFTTALPSAQDGDPMTVDTSGGSFTISALRVANAGQHFGEINQLAGPDYRAVNRARYNKAPSPAIASKPVLLGSADFPMFTSGVEQQAQGDGSGATANPFAGIAARYGRAHAEGSEFVCECDIDEPGYLFVMCSLVPEANYAEGIAKDMTIFTEEGSISDLPNAQLERIGLEPVYEDELVSINPTNDDPTMRDVFGYQPRYMWHKAGSPNMVSGLFREGASLESFIPQRKFDYNRVLRISTDFLKVKPTDLDNVMAVSGDLSKYGVMIDSAINVFVSEPLGESALPSLVDPGAEHGASVYLKRGGISVND